MLFSASDRTVRNMDRNRGTCLTRIQAGAGNQVCRNCTPASVAFSDKSIEKTFRFRRRKKVPAAVLRVP
jgi:hypothetical protein